MFTLSTLTLLLAHKAARPAYSGRMLSNEIDALPGAPEVPFKMFSGYVNVALAGKPARNMFYWFVESQGDPSTDPLFLWTNGGPGCSGLGGFLTEQGPFRPKVNGTGLELNPNAWNTIANMVFIEQPVGVGFSNTKDNIDYGDEQAATDNYRFIHGFLDIFEPYKSNDFYISSESYGGHYMPTLAREIVLGDRGVADKINFKGVAVGNPLTYMPYRNYGQYGTAYGHQLLPKPLWDQYIAADCKNTWPTPKACDGITDQMDQILSNFDGYALDFPTCADGGPLENAARHEQHALFSAIKKAGNRVAGYFPEDYEACAMTWGADYLNRPDVQAAIHVDPAADITKWSMCADINYNATDVNLPMMPVWKWLVASGANLKIMIYSGDDDSVCATLGTQQFVWDLGLTAISPWKPWKVADQVAGFLSVFEGNFALATVHGAGHMVPQTRPAQSLALMKSFLATPADAYFEQA